MKKTLAENALDNVSGGVAVPRGNGESIKSAIEAPPISVMSRPGEIVTPPSDPGVIEAKSDPFSAR